MLRTIGTCAMDSGAPARPVATPLFYYPMNFMNFMSTVGSCVPSCQTLNEVAQFKGLAGELGDYLKICAPLPVMIGTTFSNIHLAGHCGQHLQM